MSAIDELQRQASQLQATSQEAHAHLTCMSDTLKLMADNTATTADVDMAMRQLQSTMLEVGEHAAQEVQRACKELMHSNLATGAVENLGGAVDKLQLSMEEMACELRNMEEGLRKIEAGLGQLGQQTAAEHQVTRDVILAVRCFHLVVVETSFWETMQIELSAGRFRFIVHAPMLTYLILRRDIPTRTCGYCHHVRDTLTLRAKLSNTT